MDRMQETLQQIDAYYLAKKEEALKQRDEILKEQLMLRNRWRGN